MGIVEDVVVKVEKFMLTTDSVVLDYAADINISIILGPPFLATGRSCGYISMIADIDAENDPTNRGGKVAPKKKQAKRKWVKNYLYGFKKKKWVRKSYPRDDSSMGSIRYWCHATMLNLALLGVKLEKYGEEMPKAGIELLLPTCEYKHGL
ncbi:hypothetical protein HAX54_004644 [Datura stramonium]|uniref:Uncharacterized protein n=1 Tax=Datura stramonium TaxID=4076 RepID=A0ABS8T7B5_DATST|nr:hypothetical protein [Datura stramonium]